MASPVPGWATKKLAELFSLEHESINPAGFRSELFEHYSIPAWDELGGPVLEPGSAIGSSKTLVTKPTILVSKLNPRKPRVVLVEGHSGGRRCASTEFIPYVSRSDEADLRFYRRFFESGGFQRRLEQVATGTTNSHVRARPSETLTWDVPFPPLAEQRQVAEILDTLDEGIRGTEQLVAKLELMKQGLLHDLLTRGIDEDGELRDPTRHPEQFKDSPLGRIPADWEVATAADVCRRIEVGIVIRPTQYYRSSGVPILRSANVREAGIDMSDLVFMSETAHAMMSKSAVVPGDLVTVRTGYPGTTAVVPEGLPTANCVDIIISRPGPRVRSDFLATWINSEQGKGQVLRSQGGLAQQHFNVGELKRLLVPVPSVGEQERISQAVGSVIGRVDHELALARKFRSLKEGLKEDLLTGRILVTNLLDGDAA